MRDTLEAAAPRGIAAPMTKRIAFARINQETNALSPVPTTMHDFEAAHLVEGDALLRACSPGGREVPGLVARAELAGFVEALRAHRADVEPVPLFSAWAPPSGPLSREAFDVLREKLVDQLRHAGRIDAMYLCLHGAMGVAGVPDPEHALLAAAREVLGGAPIFASYDLHANLTRARVEASDALQSYQTNPHRDHARVGGRAGAVLARIVAGRLRPTVAWRSLPMILGGGTTIDFLPTMLPVFLRMKWMERAAGVVGAGVNMCHPWNAHPDLGWSTAVVTDGDEALAERFADELAEMCWARRHAGPPRFVSASLAIAAARTARVARRLGTVLLVDMSDLVGAGGPGDNTAIVRALIEEGRGLRAYAPIRDANVARDLCSIADGREVEVTLGSAAAPLTVRGVLQSKRRRPGFERSVVIAVGDVRLVVTEGPPLVMRPSFYSDVGLDPWRADIIVVKTLFPALLHFAGVARKRILVETRGVTDLDAARDFMRTDPVHPFDLVHDWRGADERRRA